MSVDNVSELTSAVGGSEISEVVSPLVKLLLNSALAAAVTFLTVFLAGLKEQMTGAA